MSSSIDDALERLQIESRNIQLQVAILGLMIELDSRKRAQANPDSSCSSDVENIADSEPQQEIDEGCSDVDISCDQTSEEEALAPSP
jgi:hypothetical protein